MSPPSRAALPFRRLAPVVAAATLVLVGVGGLVRATGSGLGCLDQWPKCRGGWIAPAEYTAVIEYSHRVVAAVVVVLVVALAVTSRRLRPRERVLRRLSWTTVGVIVGQAVVGGLVVFRDLHAAVVTVHFLLATALVALTTGIAAAAASAGRARASGRERRVAGMAAGALAGTFLVLLAGTYVRERGAGLAFGDWPLMAGRVVPPLRSVPAVLQFGHRVLAGLVLLHVVALAVRARKDARREVRVLSGTVLVLYLAQAGLGAANVLTRLMPAAVLGHVALAALTWSALVALVVVSRRAGVTEAAEPAVAASRRAGASRAAEPAGLVRSVRAYVDLTKPRIVLLLLVTTVPAMVLAERGVPPLWLVLATLCGGVLTAGGANAINQYLDRDIDEKMSRTRARPLPAHRVEPARALWFGVALAVVGFVELWVTANLLAGLLAVGAVLFYVFVYTIWLKRSTAQNIVIGGAAGAVPVLVGWAAVTGTVGLPAWILFAVIFLWTPPHFWALALRYRDDYAAAGVPMLPVVGGTTTTTRHILAYTAQLIAATLLLYPAARMGPVYLVAAAVLGAGFAWRAIGLHRTPTTASAMRLFKYSINYLALLFAAVAVDSLLLR